VLVVVPILAIVYILPIVKEPTVTVLLVITVSAVAVVPTYSRAAVPFLTVL